MKINRLSPQGYCGGVTQAINKVNEVLDNPNYPRPIYLLGSIIHNKTVMEKLLSKGAILIEEKGKTRLELLDKITSGTVLFSAHGVSPATRKKAQQKNLTIVDTTCPYVKIIQNKIEDYLKKNYQILYIGTKGHPECEAILGISSSIILITSLNDVLDLKNIKENIYVTNQTTLSLFDTDLIYKEIQKKFNNAILDNKICQATTIRQQAVFHQPVTDLCIVVGDKTSSNTEKLKKACEQAGIKAILIEDKKELENYSLQNISSISITSGASTPTETVDEIIQYLKRL